MCEYLGFCLMTRQSGKGAYRQTPCLPYREHRPSGPKRGCIRLGATTCARLPPGRARGGVKSAHLKRRSCTWHMIIPSASSILHISLRPTYKALEKMNITPPPPPKPLQTTAARTIPQRQRQTTLRRQVNLPRPCSSPTRCPSRQIQRRARFPWLHPPSCARAHQGTILAPTEMPRKRGAGAKTKEQTAPNPLV